MKQNQQKLQHQLILGISRSFIILIEKKLCLHLLYLTFVVQQELHWLFPLEDRHGLAFVSSTCLCSALCVGINRSMQAGRSGTLLVAALWSQASLLTSKHALFFFLFLVSLQLKNCCREQKPERVLSAPTDFQSAPN